MTVVVVPTGPVPVLSAIDAPLTLNPDVAVLVPSVAVTVCEPEDEAGTVNDTPAEPKPPVEFVVTVATLDPAYVMVTCVDAAKPSPFAVADWPTVVEPESDTDDVTVNDWVFVLVEPSVDTIFFEPAVDDGTVNVAVNPPVPLVESEPDVSKPDSSTPLKVNVVIDPDAT